MNASKIRMVIAVNLLFTATASVNADTMECDGNLVSPGDTMQTVLQNCGEPSSRNGDQWIYQSQDQDTPSNIVTFSGGLVDSISVGNFPGFQNTPFENKP
jgi:hypothetical protein